MLRIAFGVLGLVALVWIPLRNVGNPNCSHLSFFSYFTIQSNILGIIVLLVGGLRDPSGGGAGRCGAARAPST